MSEGGGILRPETGGSALAFATAALVLLVSLCALDGFDLLQVSRFQASRPGVSRPLLNAAIYAGTYLACVSGLFVLLCHARPWIRWPAVGLSGGCVALFAAYQSINGYGFTHHEAAIVWSEGKLATDAISFFLPTYALPVVIVAGSLAAFVWATGRSGVRVRALWVLAMPVAAGALASQLIDSTYGKVYQLPVPVRLPLLAEWAREHRVPYYGPREAPSIAPATPPLAPHVVLVVDESVTGHWLEVNGGVPGTTPYLSSNPEGVFGYGVASAVSNLSSTSNIILQSGLRADQLPDSELRALKGPNVFAFMAAAGYQTALIDAQSYSDRPQNLMSRFDIEALDHHLKLRERSAALPEHEIDFDALSSIAQLVRGADRSFTYVIKNGAHFPYGDKAPPGERPFTPGPAADALAVARAAYLNAIRWSTDHYLEALHEALGATGREVLVLYTSDHGQSLTGQRPDRARRVSPHATPQDPPVDQASVPIIAVAVGPETTRRFEALYRPELKDRVSAFEIFPTMLRVAGYAERDVRLHYGASLFDVDADRSRRIFASGNLFAREGGFYVLNPMIGDVCYLNEFRRPSRP